LIAPIFEDLIRICSALKFLGILLLYSLIDFPPQIIFSGRFVKIVFGFIFSVSNPAAIVNVLKTEPSS